MTYIRCAGRETRRPLTGLSASATRASRKGNVNTGFCKPSQASPSFWYGIVLHGQYRRIRPPTRREFGIAAHLQRTTRADCIRNPFNHPLELLGSEPSSGSDRRESTRRSQRVVKYDQAHRELVYRPLQFNKRSQHFIGSDDETLSVAMRVHNPDRSPFTVQAESGIMEIVGDVSQYLTAIAFY